MFQKLKKTQNSKKSKLFIGRNNMIKNNKLENKKIKQNLLKHRSFIGRKNMIINNKNLKIKRSNRSYLSIEVCTTTSDGWTTAAVIGK